LLNSVEEKKKIGKKNGKKVEKDKSFMLPPIVP
jgi:hypothetical protein